uniref:Uncharacterized protein n=1 Tax=Steinernema glaseri TaxID=37863 RepID=A0A1I7Z8Y5_9BILA
MSRAVQNDTVSQRCKENGNALRKQPLQWQTNVSVTTVRTTKQVHKCKRPSVAFAKEKNGLGERAQKSDRQTQEDIVRPLLTGRLCCLVADAKERAKEKQSTSSSQSHPRPRRCTSPRSGDARTRLGECSPVPHGSGGDWRRWKNAAERSDEAKTRASGRGALKKVAATRVHGGKSPRAKTPNCRSPRPFLIVIATGEKLPPRRWRLHFPPSHTTSAFSTTTLDAMMQERGYGDEECRLFRSSSAARAGCLAQLENK